MGKIVFFYTNHGNAPEPSKKWIPREYSQNPYVNLLPTEGYYFLLRELKRRGYVDDVLLIIESNRSPGHFEHEGMQGYTVPHIKDSRQFINEGDIIWARGGFRSWHDYLIYLQKEGFWLMLYAANTGRERWPFWDIILDDLRTEEIFDRRGRLWVHFKKPMNQDLFYPTVFRKKYDICIGASHIHDRKGQYKTLEALDYLQVSTGKTLKCVMPGSSRGGTFTRPWLNDKQYKRLNIHAPGMVTRPELARIFNESRMFCYLGGAGQGDRGPLEAMACGTPLFIGPTSRLAPVVYNNQEVTKICITYNDPDMLQEDILSRLEDISQDPFIREKTVNHFLKENGIDVAVENMADLICFMRNNPGQNKEVLKKYAQSRYATCF